MNVTESLLKVMELTNKNLSVLKAINDSFYTKQSHISADVDGTRYTIPSFLALENKVNHLQDAFENLVHSAQSGDAWMNFDGNTKQIVLQGFQQAPNPISLQPVSEFNSEASTLFKDMMNPKPYISLNMNGLPDNVRQILVKKIIPYNVNLIEALKSFKDSKDALSTQASYQISYADIVKILASGPTEYKNYDDYLEYDTIYDMPVRKLTCDGVYIIESIISDVVDSDCNEYITVRIDSRTPLEYILADGVSKNDICIGCTLTSYDGSLHLQVVDIKIGSRIMKLKVMHGSYINLQPNDSPAESIDAISDYSKLRFYTVDSITLLEDKILKVPLEEDRYVFVAVAPMNSTIGLRSTWGSGLFLDVDMLINGDRVKNSATPEWFRDFYNKNVQNIGDILAELSAIMSPSITKYDSGTYDLFTKTTPKLDYNPEYPTLKVVQINKHLNDSESARNIRQLYSQKKQCTIELKEVQGRIATLSEELSEISFDDISGTRTIIQSQISDLRLKQNDLIANITKLTDAISVSANDSVIPIEDAKFHIRGYFDIDSYLSAVFGQSYNRSNILKEVLGIQVQYRYKNPDTPQTNAAVINNFLFTEWVDYNPPLRKPVMSYSNGSYDLEFDDINIDGSIKITENDQKFNQIDIPISQGEIVDVRVRVVWKFGYPFAQITSQWSDPYSVEFPEELVQDVQLTTIIEENNSDIETNRFKQILIEGGYSDHVANKVMDQDITYFHKPENIPSGFYTEERRIIPLSDKLKQLQDDVITLRDYISGTFSESIQVSLLLGGCAYNIQREIDNQIFLSSYAQILPGAVNSGSAIKRIDGGVVQDSAILKLTNTSNHIVRLFSCIPGPYTDEIGTRKGSLETSFSKYIEDFATPSEQQWTEWFSDNEMARVTILGGLIFPGGSVPGVQIPGGPIYAGSPKKPYRKDYVGLGFVNKNSIQLPDNLSTTVNDMKTTCGGLMALMMKTFEDITRTSYGDKLKVSSDDDTIHMISQRQNQFIYFNKYNPYNEDVVGVYSKINTCWLEPVQMIMIHAAIKSDDTDNIVDTVWDGILSIPSNIQLNSEHPPMINPGVYNLMVLPILPNATDLCIPMNNSISSKTLAPGESISVPLTLLYKLAARECDTASFTLGFTIRPSLYDDPHYYQITFNAKYNNTATDDLQNLKISNTESVKYNVTVR